MSQNKDILAISAGVREKMDRQYLEDTRSLKNVGNCFRSARNLYDKVLLVEKVLIRIHEYKKIFIRTFQEHRRQGALVEDLIYRARALYRSVGQ